MHNNRSVSPTRSRLAKFRASRRVRFAPLKAVYAGMLLFAATTPLRAQSKPQSAPNNEDRLRQTSAVTLNYCRAAFHRIKSCPSKRVLLEEQERILSNLDLNRVADVEVVKLYTAVLHEIGQTNVLTKEREVIRGRYKRVFRKKMVANVVAFGSVIANGEYGKALRIGAGSWWDYRTMAWNRGVDLWQLEKKQIENITGKSSLFLDTFWKLTRKRSIPDRWLIRSSDLDRLDAALREADPNVRLRVLKRMRPFMECYPPYWYYVARTQQQLGKLQDAAETYQTLEAIGRGHFRNDELLATGAANRAAIQDYLKNPDAVKTARRALAYSADAWEVNLMCASVLHRHRRDTAAEDALLRNLDVKLETEQSLAALLVLYCDTKNLRKLSKRLSAAKTIDTVPVPALLRCATFLSAHTETAKNCGATETALRRKISRRLSESLAIRTDRHFGPDDLCVVASPQWQLPSARLAVAVAGKRFSKHETELKDDRHKARFRGVLDLGSLIKPVPLNGPITVHVTYPGGTHVTATMERSQSVAPTGFFDSYRVNSLTIGSARVPVADTSGRTTPRPTGRQPRLPTDRPAPPSPPANSQPQPATAGTGPDLIPPPPKRRSRAKRRE